MSDINKDVHKHDLLGGRLCLDFANTVSWHDSSEESQELLTSYEKLVNWSLHANILNKQQSLSLLKKAEDQPAKAIEVLQQAIELRESIYQIFSLVTKNETPASKDLAILNEALSNAYGKMRVVLGENKFSLEFLNGEETLDGMLPPIVQSAIDILTSEKELSRVKKCEGHPCGWLFLDTSRNRSRRWCSMADCGNRAKAKRFYRNKK
ncbi:CGNR zinc finger domain-containing protein [Neobacillus rhizophilus]|uniref:CGNR zinc finger domain-containing protein n=1 Tax=Neobacillus rhizophilus TaxID=2833579 RepID=A0A942U3L7_9BACI|nr:CGNR zinc finger domain-containing protein [Neobacillus rhizophilus]MBS4214030.1 CGNR zinc finger domain-containing protein [Neobacillus rhizophilus]MBU8917567.1 CGNR zinc finger domain-containing protein [Bacillus sp. FJAT-29953]